MQKYKVTLNYMGEVHIFYTSAVNSGKAVLNAVSKLSNKLSKSKYYLRNYILDGKDRWKVKQVTQHKDNILPGIYDEHIGGK